MIVLLVHKNVYINVLKCTKISVGGSGTILGTVVGAFVIGVINDVIRKEI